MIELMNNACDPKAGTSQDKTNFVEDDGMLL